MPPLISMKFDGFDFLEKALIELGQAVEIRKAITAGLIEAAEPMARAMRAGAPTASIAETIDVSKTLSRRQRRAADRQDANTASVYVGPKPVGPALLIEFGTVRRHWKTGKATGSVPARPFMRPGFESTKVQVLELFGKLMWIQIEKAANRIARRQAKAKAK